MPGVNKVILVGNLGKDPELKYAKSGDAVCSFSLATSDTWKDNDGNQQERVEWHNIVCFKSLAEICGKYLNKGQTVYVEGSIKSKSWQDNDGVTHKGKDIVINKMDMIGSRSDGKNPQNAKPKNQPSPPMDDDSLPF